MSNETTLPGSTSGQNFKPLLLRPVIHPAVARFLGEQQVLQQLVAALGSPLNLMFPGLLKQNTQAYIDTFKKHGVQGRVFFAHKTTLSDSLVRQLAVEKVSLDVASLDELRHGLASGFDGSRMEATGPKNADFMALCLMHGVTLNVDSLAELEQLSAIRKRLPVTNPTRVLLRLSGLQSATALAKSSRFGISLPEVDQAFSLLEQNRGQLAFLGLSFHLDSISAQERLAAIEKCLDLFEQAIARGFEPQVLNIGGGFRVNYLANPQDWSDYTSALKESVLGTGQQITWQKMGFGMSAEAGKLKGNFNTYGYHEPAPGARFLEDILNTTLPSYGEKTVASVLQSNMIELWIEPGRSLVDQAGVTVARVNSLRKASTGEQLVLLNMKRQDLAFLDQEVFVDPVVIYRTQPDATTPHTVPVFFAGDLCLESDLICRHLTFLSKLPEPGDLVAFLNTAGYFMDFSACSAIMQPVARKVAVCEDVERFVWIADEQYSPVWNFYTTKE